MRRCKTIKCKVKELQSFMKQQTATHIHRTRTATSCGVTAKVTAICEDDEGGKITDIEAAMANLRYFDPATNALVTADPSTGTYHRDVRVAVFRKLTLKNNYQVPLKVQVFSCIPRDATNVTPKTCHSDGLADQGNPGALSALVYITDSMQLRDMWKCKMVANRVIKPGSQIVATANTPLFNYEISTNDAHNLKYQKKQGGHVFMYRIHGVLGHDTVAAEYGLLPGRVDHMMDVVYKFNYDAGKDLHDISVSDSSNTFTNSGVVSNRPVVDNQALSTA